VRALAEADLVLHVGDITESFVLDLLAELAPVEAVAGNNDGPELVERLGHTRVVTVESVRSGMTHGHLGTGRSTPERALRTFEQTDPPLAAVAFGHSHQPLVGRNGTTWLLNPGSPTDRRREPSFSFLRVRVTGAELEPELVRYDHWRTVGRRAASVLHRGRA
jgi:putative phosphoesterase